MRAQISKTLKTIRAKQNKYQSLHYIQITENCFDFEAIDDIMDKQKALFEIKKAVLDMFIFENDFRKKIRKLK